MAKVRKCVITAAGRGTRQYPASAALAKEMFPLVDRDGITKPVMQIIAEEALDSGIEEICIITQPGDEPIYRNYFRKMDDATLKVFKGKEWAILQSEKLEEIGQRLHFAVQETQEGFGHAVYQAKKFSNGEPILLMLGDHVYISSTKDRCARQNTRVFEENDVSAVTAVQPTMEKELHLFGTIRGEQVHPERGAYKAHLIIEKPSIDQARTLLTTPGLPAGTYLSHFGIHVFGPGIFDSLEYLIKNNIREKNEVQLTAAQEHLRQATNKYWVNHTYGLRLDVGIPSGLLESYLALGLHGVHRAEFCEAITRILAGQPRS